MSFTIKQQLYAAQQQLRAQSQTPALEARRLLAAALAVTADFLLRESERLLTVAEQQRFAQILVRRCDGEPLAYILGQCGFWSLDLRVSPDVLIPRADTETLVEQVLARLPLDQPAQVLDLGSGSGAIALAIAAERPQAEVWAVERSPAALALAQQNAERLGLRVRWLAGDWFAPLPTGLCFDVIVSNPPYIAADDPHLPDLQHEPVEALVSAEQGLADLKHIIQHAPASLKPGGWLLLEHGWQQGGVLRDLLRLGGFQEVLSVHDLGGQERVSGGRLAQS